MKKILRTRMFPLTLLFLVFFCFRCEKDFFRSWEEPWNKNKAVPSFLTVTDIDGHLYHTVKIGDHVWMAENLKVTRYRNGDPVNFAADKAAFKTYGFSKQGAYCNYSNDENLAGIYGRLYNVYAALDTRKIAPAGWHVPETEEWEQLKEFLGGEAIAGGKLKEAGTLHWLTPNTGATNETGFTALPGGFFEEDYTGLTTSCALFSWYNLHTWDNQVQYQKYTMSYTEAFLNRVPVINPFGFYYYGFSIRCIKNVVPTVRTFDVTSITGSSARSGGEVTFDGGSEIISRGVCWHNSPHPTIKDSKTIDGAGFGSFTSLIKVLKQKSTYYVRAYATNSEGTGYGNELVFKTDDKGVIDSLQTITDIDGNKYRIVTIGTQTWMAENLKTTKYNDGTPVRYAGTGEGGSYAWYHDSIDYKDIYGALYNFSAVNSNKLAPVGWHIPSLAEFQTLVNFLGGSDVAGGKLKETGYLHWLAPNTGATDETAFTALPGGGCGFNREFYYIGIDGNWWSTTGYDIETAYCLRLNYSNQKSLLIFTDKIRWQSVRCIRN